jgi:hypothetical protein
MEEKNMIVMDTRTTTMVEVIVEIGMDTKIEEIVAATITTTPRRTLAIYNATIVRNWGTMPQTALQSRRMLETSMGTSPICSIKDM